MSKRSRSAGRTSVKSHAGKASSKKRAKSVASTKSNRAAKLASARMVANAVTMGFMGIEKKFLDSAKALTAVASVGLLTGGEYDPSSGCTGCLSCPAQGDTEQSRDGKRIVIDSVIIKGFVECDKTASAAIPDATKCFVAVVLDTQTNGAQLNSEDVFKNTTTAAYTAVNPLKNLLFGSRFRILKSQVYDLTPIGVIGAAANYAHGDVRRDFDWYIPFKGGLPVNLNAGTTADVANVIDNSIHVVAFATTGEVVQIAYNARIRFQG